MLLKVSNTISAVILDKTLSIHVFPFLYNISDRVRGIHEP